MSTVQAIWNDVPKIIARASLGRLHVTIEKVTPKRAIEYLRSMPPKQRNIRQKHVRKLARQMAHGDWRLNGETIVFNASGEMIDGQHRCKACVAADHAFETIVVRGVEDRVFDTLDSGAARIASDVLRMDGAKEVHRLSHALKFLWLEERGLPIDSKEMPDNPSLADLYGRHSEITDFVTATHRLPFRRGVSWGLMAYLYYRTHRRAPHDADEFFARLCDGTNLTKTSPIGALRNRLVSNPPGGGSRGVSETAELYIRAWNAYRQRRSLTRLTVRGNIDVSEIM